MAATATPDERSQAVSVEKTSRKGSPATKPRNSIVITGACR